MTLYEVVARYAEWVMNHDGDNLRDVYGHAPDDEILGAVADGCAANPSEWLDEMGRWIVETGDTGLVKLYGAACALV